MFKSKNKCKYFSLFNSVASNKGIRDDFVNYLAKEMVKSVFVHDGLYEISNHLSKKNGFGTSDYSLSYIIEDMKDDISEVKSRNSISLHSRIELMKGVLNKYPQELMYVVAKGMDLRVNEADGFKLNKSKIVNAPIIRLFKKKV